MSDHAFIYTDCLSLDKSNIRGKRQTRRALFNRYNEQSIFLLAEEE